MRCEQCPSRARVHNPQPESRRYQSDGTYELRGDWYCFNLVEKVKICVHGTREHREEVFYWTPTVLEYKKKGGRRRTCSFRWRWWLGYVGNCEMQERKCSVLQEWLPFGFEMGFLWINGKNTMRDERTIGNAGAHGEAENKVFKMHGPRSEFSRSSVRTVLFFFLAIAPFLLPLFDFLHHTVTPCISVRRLKFNVQRSTIAIVYLAHHTF